MSSPDAISILLSIIVLLVTAVGIISTIALTRISHVQASDAYNVLQIQQFETTFFNLLNTLNNSVNRISFLYEDGKIISGNAFFEMYMQELVDKLSFEQTNHESLFEYENAYDKVYYKFITPLDFFIANLEVLALFIDRKNLSEENSRFYYSIIASQLNDTQRVVLQYHIKLRVFSSNEAQRARLKKILWRTGTISLSDYHSFILDADISVQDDNEK